MKVEVAGDAGVGRRRLCSDPTTTTVPPTEMVDEEGRKCSVEDADGTEFSRQNHLVKLWILPSSMSCVCALYLSEDIGRLRDTLL